MVEGKIRGRMEEQGGRFFLIFFFLVQTNGLVIDEFRYTNDLAE
jgi:hypothetical protein